MKYKKIMILAIFLVSLLAISAVSAAENATDDIVSADVSADVVSVEETTDEVVSVENYNQVIESSNDGIDFLSANPDGTFTDLANEIANANGQLNLTKNYVYSTGDSKYVNGIEITKKITINGKGFVINGNNQARAFNIAQKDVTLRNIRFTNFNCSSNGAAVYWNGDNGNLFDCNFLNCYGPTAGGAVYWKSDNGNLFDCNFVDCHSITSGGAVYWEGNNGNMSGCDFENCYSSNSISKNIGNTKSLSNYDYGGAVYWKGNDGNMVSCDFKDCYSSSSINYSFSTTSYGTITSTDTCYGGAVYWYGDNGNMSDCDFEYCYGSSYCYSNSYGISTVSNVNSYTHSYGGAVYWKGNNGNLIDCNFWNCRESSSSSGFTSRVGNGYSYGYGGAIFWEGTGGNLVGCIFYNCRISSSSFGSSYGEATSYGYGGAVYWRGDGGNIFNSSFKNFNIYSSTSSFGSAIYWYGDNGNMFNCDFNGTYYDYQKFCKAEQSVYPVLLIHTSTLNNDDRIVVFEATQLVKNITVSLYDVSNKITLYKQFSISSKDLNSFSVNDLEDGEYQVVLDYSGDGFYSSTSSNNLFRVGKNSTYEVTITENLIEGDNATINLTLNEDTTGKVKLTLPNHVYINELVDGKTSFNISGVLGGNNAYQIKYVGDDKYNPIYLNGTFNVLFKSNINLDFKDNYIFGDDILLNYTITPNCMGIISIYIDNGFKTNITVGEVFELDNINAGKYNITFIYNGDEHFATCSNSAILTVSKVDSSIEVNSSNLPGDVSVDVILNEKATGNITITINDNSYPEGLIGGKANIIIPNLNAGNHTVKINYTGDNNYNAKIYDYQLFINKMPTTVSGTVEDITYSQNSIINVKGSVEGIAVVKIDENYIKNINIIENTITPVTFENISAGKHNVTITLKPTNNNYDESTLKTEFTVSKKETTIQLDVEDSVYGGDVIINITASEDGKVILKVGSIIREKNVFANSLTKFNLGVLSVDSYDIGVSFDAGDNYKPSSDEGNIVVSPAEAKITEIQSNNNIYGENTVVKVKTNVAGTLNIKFGSNEKIFNVDANKLTSLDLGILDVGLKNIEITLDAGSNYTKPTMKTSVTVSPKSTAVNVNVKNCIYGENVIVKVTASENGKVSVKLGDAVKYVNVNANMLTSVDFGILNVESYSVDVSFDGGNNYVKSYDTASLTVSPAQSKIIDIQKQDYVYGDNVIIKVKTNVGGKLIATIGYITKNINIVGNQLTSIDFGIMNANNYDVKISLNAGDNYISSQNTTKITIKPKNTAVTLNVNEYDVKEHVIVKVTASENGKATIKLNNIVKTIDVAANKATAVDFDVLSIGLYKVTANFAAGNNYADSSSSATFKVVSKLDEKDINISVPEIKANEENNIVINLPADATGTVTLTIGDNSYISNVKNGVANINVPKLPDGNYKYVINYSGDNKYGSFENFGNIEVSKPTPEIVVPPLDKPATDGSVTIKLPTDATGTVTLTIDGKKYDFNVKNGVANVKLPELANGDYPYTIKYSGDSKYSSFVDSGSLKVENTVVDNRTSENKTDANANEPTVKPDVVIPPLDNPSSDGSVTVSLPSDATGKVTLTINGKDYNYLVENGVVNVIIPNLGDGNYPYTIKYSGDSKYSSFVDSGSLKVENTVVVDNRTSENKTDANANEPTVKPDVVIPPLDKPSSDGSVTISLPTDATGKVTLTINGKNYNFLVENGVANVIIPNLGDGDYPYIITYSGDSKYSSFTNTGSLKVKKDSVNPVENQTNTTIADNSKIVASNKKVTYATGKYYTINVYGGDGQLANGVEVVITVNGKTFKTLTTKEGVAKFKVTQKPGTYKMTITALNKNVTKTLTVKHLVTLKSVTVKRSAKKLVLQATLGKVNGKYLKNKKITFKFNGKKYTAKTNKKGVAKVTIKSSILKKLKVGKKVTYQATYLKDTVKKTVKVKK